MIQINNGFAAYYYLNEDGTIYNESSGRLIKPDKQHFFYLKTVEGATRKIALQTIYKRLFKHPYCEDTITDLNGEVWKPIDEKYYVSNKGRIKSMKGYSAVLLKPFINKSGYARVDIYTDGKRQSKLVSRLVAAAFLPLPQKLDMQLHHKDFNKLNNSADNLIWLTCKEHNRIHKEKNNAK